MSLANHSPDKGQIYNRLYIFHSVLVMCNPHGPGKNYLFSFNVLFRQFLNDFLLYARGAGNFIPGNSFQLLLEFLESICIVHDKFIVHPTPFYHNFCHSVQECNITANVRLYVCRGNFTIPQNHGSPITGHFELYQAWFS